MSRPHSGKSLSLWEVDRLHLIPSSSRFPIRSLPFHFWITPNSTLALASQGLPLDSFRMPSPRYVLYLIKSSLLMDLLAHVTSFKLQLYHLIIICLGQRKTVCVSKRSKIGVLGIAACQRGDVFDKGPFGTSWWLSHPGLEPRTWSSLLPSRASTMTRLSGEYCPGC